MECGSGQKGRLNAILHFWLRIYRRWAEHQFHPKSDFISLENSCGLSFAKDASTVIFMHSNIELYSPEQI